MQGSEGAPDAWIEIEPAAADALHGIAAGDDLFLFTWLHAARRDVLQTYPRDDLNNPLTGVFATRSQDRPNPIGLHRVRVARGRATPAPGRAAGGDRRHTRGRHQAGARAGRLSFPGYTEKISGGTGRLQE